MRVGDEGTPRVLLIDDPPASLPITLLLKVLIANTKSLACEQGWNQNCFLKALVEALNRQKHAIAEP